MRGGRLHWEPPVPGRPFRSRSARRWPRSAFNAVRCASIKVPEAHVDASADWYVDGDHRVKPTAYAPAFQARCTAARAMTMFMTIGALVAAIPARAGAEAVVAYTVRDLATLGGTTSLSDGYATLNAAGWVVGH